MKASTQSFRGMAPRLTPRALPDNAAQHAVNARLLTGDLQPWKRPAFVHALANIGVVRSIFLLNDVWLSWTQHVDAARGTILGDTTYRTFLTGPEVYGAPRFTNYALATSGPEPYPFATRPLGVPGPETAPTLEVGVDTTPTTFSVDVLDEGDALATSWSTSPDVTTGFNKAEVSQDASVGNPAPSYLIGVDENESGPPAYLYRNFGIANASVVTTSTDFMCFFVTSAFNGPTKQCRMTLQADSSGNGAQILVLGEGATATLGIGISTGWGTNTSQLGTIAIPGGIDISIWYTLEAKSVLNADGTRTVTATLYEGSGQLATLTLTNNFSAGDYVGFMARTSNDEQGPDPRGFLTYHDNIHVRASGNSGVQILNLATSYVYTYVNDLGQESAPSPASATIQRPDGVTVTVTTPGFVETGISDDYGIVTKRLYRAVTGALGSVFRFVAEMPVATTEYVDILTDSQLGEELESTYWNTSRNRYTKD